jgi:hypothetical protein
VPAGPGRPQAPQANLGDLDDIVTTNESRWRSAGPRGIRVRDRVIQFT